METDGCAIEVVVASGDGATVGMALVATAAGCWVGAIVGVLSAAPQAAKTSANVAITSATCRRCRLYVIGKPPQLLVARTRTIHTPAAMPDALHARGAVCQSRISRDFAIMRRPLHDVGHNHGLMYDTTETPSMGGVAHAIHLDRRA